MKTRWSADFGFFRDNLYFLAVLCILLGLAFTPVRLVSFAACVVLWGLYWPFSQKINSLVLRLALAFVLVTCLQELLGALFWIMHVNFTVPFAVAIELLIVLWFRWQYGAIQKTAVINRADIVSLLVAAGSVAVLVAGMLHGGGLLPQLLRQITTGFDGTNHLSLTITDYDHNGYVYGSPRAVRQEIIVPKLSSYPQGWSLTTSLWWHSVSSNLNIRKHPTKVLLLFYCLVFIWFGLIVYLFNRLMLYLVVLIRGKPLNLVALTGSAALTLLAELMGIIGVVYHNFASFLPALALPLCMVFLVAAVIEDSKDKRQPAVFLISGLLIAGGLSFSWLLAAPMAYCATLLGLISYCQGSFVALVKWLIAKPLTLLAGVVLVVLGCAQGVIQVLYGDSELINQPGGAIPIYPQILFPMLLLVLLVLYLGKAQTIRNAFAATISGIFLTTGAVYFYQVASVGHTSYYSSKITLIASVLIMVFASAVLLAILSDWVSANRNSFVAVIFAASLIVFIPVATDMNLTTVHGEIIGSLNYLLGERFMSENTATILSNELESGRISNGNFLLYKGVGRPEDVATSHFVETLSRKPLSDCGNTIFNEEMYRWKIYPREIAACANGQNFYIMASKRTYAVLTKDFQQYPNVKILLSN